METLDSFLVQFGLLAVFVLMFVKSAGVPIPVPSDAIILGVGAATASQRLVGWQAFLVILLAMMLGGLLQYSLVRGPARALVYRFGRFVGLGPRRLDSFVRAIRARGPLAVAIAIMTPGVRAVAVAACALAAMSLLRFIPGLLIGSLGFLAVHFLIGFVGGTVLERFAKAVTAPWLVGGVAGLLVLGLATWVLVHWSRRARQERDPGAAAWSAIGDWQEAACPVCLLWGVASGDRGAAEAT